MNYERASYNMKSAFNAVNLNFLNLKMEFYCEKVLVKMHFLLSLRAGGGLVALPPPLII